MSQSIYDVTKGLLKFADCFFYYYHYFFLSISCDSYDNPIFIP